MKGLLYYISTYVRDVRYSNSQKRWWAEREEQWGVAVEDIYDFSYTR
jgi:hypothetical protein